MSINPKSVNSAISPVQKSEIECKTVKLKMIDSSYKIDLGQTKWRTKIRQRLKLCTKILRACPPEDQAGVIHAISPISVKLGQIEGHTQ